MSKWWVFVAACLLYVRTLTFDYTFLDDNALILERLDFLQNLGNLGKIFTLQVFYSPIGGFYYRPLLTLSFMLDAIWGGGGLWAFHLTNIFLHGGVSVLVAAVLEKFGYRRGLSIALGLVFAVHPMLTQAVAWIPGRNDLLLAAFCLGALWFLLNYYQKQSWQNLAGFGLLFSAAIFTKETTLALLPLIGLYALYKRQATRDIIRKDGIRLYLLGIGLLAVLGVWFLLRSIALALSPGYPLGIVITSFLANFKAVFLYLGKFFWPAGLSVLPTLLDSSLLPGWVAAGVLGALLVWLATKKRWLAFFGAAWFLAFLSPALIRPNLEYISDFLEHRAYLPAVGLLLILAEFFTHTGKRVGQATTALVLLSLPLAYLAFDHSQVFADRMTFWTNAAAHSPHHPLTHKNLGAMYYLDGRHQEAAASYHRALALNPKEPMIYNNLGLIYMAENNFSQAEEAYEKELEINPYYENALINYGLLRYHHQQNATGAAELWQQTIAIYPDSASAYQLLINLYLQENNATAAASLTNLARSRGINLNY